MKNDKVSASTTVGDSIRQAGHKVDQYGEIIADKSDELITRGQRAYADFKDNATDYINENTETAIKYIQKNPMKSALIAVGIGLLLSRLL